MHEKDRANLLAILDAAGKILKFIRPIADADAFFKDEKTFDAVLMNFVLIGETVAKLSDELKDGNRHVPWNKIKGFRNIIAHDYFGVDAEEVWQIIQRHIPALVVDVEKVLKEES
jgi:uncharacterized protein with HEPN domain